MIIAEYYEEIGHHELQAAHAEERRILREELWRQQLEFREVHQQSLTGWRNYENSKVPPSILLRGEKLIEDQNTILGTHSQAEYRNCKMK